MRGGSLTQYRFSTLSNVSTAQWWHVTSPNQLVRKYEQYHIVGVHDNTVALRIDLEAYISRNLVSKSSVSPRHPSQAAEYQVPRTIQYLAVFSNSEWA